MVMAGLWDVWQSREGPVHTFTILTTGAGSLAGLGGLLGWLCGRMGGRAWCVRVYVVARCWEAGGTALALALASAGRAVPSSSAEGHSQGA